MVGERDPKDEVVQRKDDAIPPRSIQSAGVRICPGDVEADVDERPPRDEVDRAQFAPDAVEIGDVTHQFGRDDDGGEDVQTEYQREEKLPATPAAANAGGDDGVGHT